MNQGANHAPVATGLQHSDASISYVWSAFLEEQVVSTWGYLGLLNLQRYPIRHTGPLNPTRKAKSLDKHSEDLNPRVFQGYALDRSSWMPWMPIISQSSYSSGQARGWLKPALISRVSMRRACKIKFGPSVSLDWVYLWVKSQNKRRNIEKSRLRKWHAEVKGPRFACLQFCYFGRTAEGLNFLNQWFIEQCCHCSYGSTAKGLRNS